jgi:hypothetical protein
MGVLNEKRCKKVEKEIKNEQEKIKVESLVNKAYLRIITEILNI